MTIYDYFNALTNIGLGEEHTEEFEDAINDTLAMIQQSTLGILKTISKMSMTRRRKNE